MCVFVYRKTSEVISAKKHSSLEQLTLLSKTKEKIMNEVVIFC